MYISLLIVVPTLNSHELLPRLVSSLIQQTWSNWRVLFVDGQSSLQHRQWLDHCCANDSRFTWVNQVNSQPGIFGAMNQGFMQARPDEWILFWGSDDYASSPTVLECLVRTLHDRCSHTIPDLVICNCRYFDASTGILTRFSNFLPPGFCRNLYFRRALFFGLTPAHQGTLFGPGSRKYLRSYNTNFYLTADLFYFLQISINTELLVYCVDLQLVNLADSGISSQQTLSRLCEVYRSYHHAFGIFAVFSFVSRYLRKFIASLSLL